MTIRRMEAARTACERFRISCRDAAIAEAAKALGCQFLLPEDRNEARDFHGARVENAFRSSGRP